MLLESVTVLWQHLGLTIFNKVLCTYSISSGLNTPNPANNGYSFTIMKSVIHTENELCSCYIFYFH